MTKIRKNSKAKVWSVYTAKNEFLGEYTFHLQEVKAYFPGCRIVKHTVTLV